MTKHLERSKRNIKKRNIIKNVLELITFMLIAMVLNIWLSSMYHMKKKSLSVELNNTNFLLTKQDSIISTEHLKFKSKYENSIFKNNSKTEVTAKRQSLLRKHATLCENMKDLIADHLAVRKRYLHKEMEESSLFAQNKTILDHLDMIIRDRDQIVSDLNALWN
jgi:hypothetical protein